MPLDPMLWKLQLVKSTGHVLLLVCAWSFQSTSHFGLLAVLAHCSVTAHLSVSSTSVVMAEDNSDLSFDLNPTKHSTPTSLSNHSSNVSSARSGSSEGSTKVGLLSLHKYKGQQCVRS